MTAFDKSEEVTVSVDYGGKKGQHVSLNVSERSHEAIESALEQKLQQEFGSWNIVKSEAFDKAWGVVKDEPDDSPYAGTSKCPCRQGYNPCDDPKCAEWHKGGN